MSCDPCGCSQGLDHGSSVCQLVVERRGLQGGQSACEPGNFVPRPIAALNSRFRPQETSFTAKSSLGDLVKGVIVGVWSDSVNPTVPASPKQNISRGLMISFRDLRPDQVWLCSTTRHECHGIIWICRWIGEIAELCASLATFESVTYQRL